MACCKAVPRTIFSMMGVTVFAVRYIEMWLMFLSLTVLILSLAGYWFMYYSFDLEAKGKYVLITGCDSGFGLATAEHLQQLGVHVIATCLNLKSSGAEKLSKLQGVSVIRMNVTSDEDIENCLQETKKIVGEKGLWGLVNNAGIATYCEFEVTPPNLAQLQVDINLTGVIKVTQKMLRLVRRAKGRVVFVSSMAGAVPGPLLSVYSATKSGVSAMANVLREEMRKWGVKVTTIEPMVFRTGLVTLQRQLIEPNLDKIDAEVREDYGEDYFETYKNEVFNSFQSTWMVNDSTDKVVRSIRASLLTSNPPRTVRIGDFWWQVSLGYKLFPEITSMVIPLVDSVFRKIVWYRKSWFEVVTSFVPEFNKAEFGKK